ncbi:single-stranded-DNA-specific exonuclease RecJ [Anoxybacillus kestanbolensis]|uniref:Single-stranded-DNA-specific exonuclease RecJ n=1 Tax=Anoxybacillus kestanbolensis TaxID=227476 RepID=A0A1V3FKZ2_9BACL|nr:single-stranded-DNA-specific exonuclease RecJ [Anoxybacillus kestanbolensis]OOE02337.1 single-stranded-DNA-specific exonuclease RecJ [Anoxybacillus kestanbolensis]
MLASKTRWNIQQVNEQQVQMIAQALHITPLVASLLVSRGYHTVEAARSFFERKQSFHSPFLLNDMEKAVERIEKAITNDEHILVFGDYDADGVSSTVVMVSALREKGANVSFYIPNRFTEGYGPNEQAFRLAKQQGVSLIITVDTGISALHEANVAKQLGIDLIITDHHEPGPVLPEAYATIHPKISPNYPFKHLAGVGVAFKLAHALIGRVPYEWLDVVAIGTIADLVPLQDENHLLARLGIEQFRQTNRLGLQALCKQCGVSHTAVTEDTIAFMIGPRVNAAGRLDCADPAVQLLLTTDAHEADMLAEQIDAMNRERQQLVNEITEEAIQLVEQHYRDDRVLVVAKEGWNVGVIGIVASRLVEKFYRPTIVLSIDQEKGIAKGSARSIEGFDLFANLSNCRDILPHFGGHPMAAGMTLSFHDVDELRRRLNEAAEQQLTDEHFIPITHIDLCCSIPDVSLELIEQMNRLAPFGMGNPKPRVLFQHVQLDTLRKIGTDQNHLKLLLTEDGKTLEAIGFGFGNIGDEIAPNVRLSIVGELAINEWNNFRKPQLMIQDIAVNEWQLFDMRHIRHPSKFMASLPKEKRLLIAFHRDTVDALQLSAYADEIVYVSHEQEAVIDVGGKYIVFLDLPPSQQIVKVLLSCSLPERIYALFYQRENHFFSVLPTREHFKWLYSFLHKRSPFDVRRYADDLARSRGWTKETILFMIQVFKELGFITVENGIVSLARDVQKRDLTESPSYRLKQAQAELEHMFLYSSYSQLKRWFDSLYEEENVNGFKTIRHDCS